MARRFTMIDLFCGAGGMSLGFTRAGFRSIFAVEHEANFARTYAANFGEHVDSRPIQDVVLDPAVRNLKADLVIGGPPCQGFSSLGPNRSDDPRRAMWTYYLDIVQSSQCRAFVLENVPNLLTSIEGETIMARARELGFHVTSKVLLASRFGVPQNRKRAFIVGSRSGGCELNLETQANVSVRAALRGIPRKPKSTELPRTEGPYRTSELHIGRKPTAVSLERYSVIPAGGNRFDLQRNAPHLTPACWLRKPKGGTDLFGRLHWDEPARCTIRTEFYKPEKGRYLHPSENRPITHWEAARLQSFPDDFLWHGSKQEIAVQIGNAVPPLLAQAIATQVLSHFEEANQLSESIPAVEP